MHLNLQNVDRQDESDRTDAYETVSLSPGKRCEKCRHVFQLGRQISTWYRGCSWWHNWSLDASLSHRTPSEGNRKEEFKQRKEAGKDERQSEEKKSNYRKTWSPKERRGVIWAPDHSVRYHRREHERPLHSVYEESEEIGGAIEETKWYKNCH